MAIAAGDRGTEPGL